jgi:hypothetical protein
VKVYPKHKEDFKDEEVEEEQPELHKFEQEND